MVCCCSKRMNLPSLVERFSALSISKQPTQDMNGRQENDSFLGAIPAHRHAGPHHCWYADASLRWTCLKGN